MDKLAVAAGVALALALETISASTVWVWLKVGPSPPQHTPWIPYPSSRPFSRPYTP